MLGTSKAIHKYKSISGQICYSFFQKSQKFAFYNEYYAHKFCSVEYC